MNKFLHQNTKFMHFLYILCIFIGTFRDASGERLQSYRLATFSITKN